MLGDIPSRHPAACSVALRGRCHPRPTDAETEARLNQTPLALPVAGGERQAGSEASNVKVCCSALARTAGSKTRCDAQAPAEALQALSENGACDHCQQAASPASLGLSSLLCQVVPAGTLSSKHSLELLDCPCEGLSAASVE